MPQPRLTDPPATELPLDPAYDDLTPDEQAQSWWRGSDDEQAVRAGDDVEWAHEEYFPSGLGRSRLNDEQWARVAYFLASGVSVMEVAKYFGVSRTTIWRGMQRSAGLRHRIGHERKMFQRESDNRFVALRHAVVDGLQQAISAGNIRVLLWAADRLDLGGTILPRQERPAIRRPVPRRHRAPAAVREILETARDRITPLTPDTLPDLPPGAPPDLTPHTPSGAGGDAPVTPPMAVGSDIPAIPEPAPPVEDLPAAPAAALPPDAAVPLTGPDAPDGAIRLAPRRARARIRALLARCGTGRRPVPQLAEDLDIRETEAMVIHSQYSHGLPRPVCDASQPVDPYRPLRHYRWP